MSASELPLEIWFWGDPEVTRPLAERVSEFARTMGKGGGEDEDVLEGMSHGILFVCSAGPLHFFLRDADGTETHHVIEAEQGQVILYETRLVRLEELPSTVVIESGFVQAPSREEVEADIAETVSEITAFLDDLTARLVKAPNGTMH